MVLRFIKGPLLQGQPTEILLDGEKSLLFGSKEVPASKDRAKFIINGERIVENHFEIVFDHNTLIMRNLNFNSWESCGVYRQLFE